MKKKHSTFGKYLWVLPIICGVLLYINLLLGLVFISLMIPIYIILMALKNNNPGEPTDLSSEQDAKDMIVLPPKARVYIMRDNFTASKQGMDISIGDSFESQILSKCFLMAELDAGKHIVTVNMASSPKKSELSYEINLDKGQILLLDVKVKMGLIRPTAEFNQINDLEIAKNMISNLKLINWK